MNYGLFFLFVGSSLLQACQEADFIKSFVTYYDCSQEGRYTHEYHPFLLQETRKSLDTLERFLQKEGFSCPHRCVIMGYQEEGVPSFLPRSNDSFLQDEYVQHSKKGRVVPAHNVFGFLTGFLLKDVMWMQQQWGMQDKHIVYHHQAGSISLFNDYAYVFQKTAFGDDIDYIFMCRNEVERALKTKQPLGVLRALCSFWEHAYKGELKSFSHQVLATQDILFSTEYAQHLLTSSIPVSTLYTGPDITYPIEILSCQQQQVTASAQGFVGYFGQKLVPVDNKKTVYVFCSFVDGVGKSTLLGNVINWKKHGSELGKYERVDNSSSQRATLYQLDDRVAILDLPAQLSHFVSKPDGFVFVHLTIAGQEATCNDLQDFLVSHAPEAIQAFDQAVQSPDNTPQTLYAEYVRVAHLYKDKIWIPFEYQQQTYLFNRHDYTKLLVAVPLEGVQSRGLKVAHPTHMLFTKGLSLPMQFDAFMQDCADMLKEAGIEKVIFVDFLSMYPRSSRENVRVNFLLQELKKLYGDNFDSEKSLYKTLVNGNLELFYDLQHQLPQFTCSLIQETVMRTALFSLCNRYTASDVRLLNQEQVTMLLQQSCQSLLEKHRDLLLELCQKKIVLERTALSPVVHDKTYQTVVNFSWKPVVAFSDFMSHVWTQQVYHPLLSSWWSDLHAKTMTHTYTSIDVENRDPLVLSPVLAHLRAAWYVSLLNLLNVRLEQGVLDRFEHPVVPCSVLHTDHHTCSIVEHVTTPQTHTPESAVVEPFTRYSLPVGYTVEAWGSINGTIVMQPYAGIETYTGIFGLGYDWSKEPELRMLVDSMVTHKKTIVCAADLVQHIEHAQLWSHLLKTKQSKKRIITSDSPYRSAIALMVRACATLEMIAKDPESMIIVRRGVYEDFKAAVMLLEKFVLPALCDITIEGQLFEDYQTLEPVISWQQVVAYP